MTHIDGGEIGRVVAEAGNQPRLQAKLRRRAGEEEKGGDEDGRQGDQTGPGGVAA